MKINQIQVIYNPDGEVVLHPGIHIFWKVPGDKNPPLLPPGIRLTLSISIDEQCILDGVNGIVWAAYDLRQAEVLLNALLAQHIGSEILTIEVLDGLLYLLKINNARDVSEATDFIWRSEGGLRLKLDWSYKAGEPNASFEAWLNGY